MKNLLVLFSLLVLVSCGKEECNSCVSYILSNQIEAQKKCDGIEYNLGDYEETYLGSDHGVACSDDEKASKEGEYKREKVSICNEVEYTKIFIIRCDK